MAVVLLRWVTSALLLAICAVVADDNLSLSCTWLSTVVDGCADDSFVFSDYTGWDLLKRHYQACLYIRENAVPPYTCQEDARLQRVLSCKAEAYNNARESLSQPQHEEGVHNFQICVTDTLSKYKREPIVVGSSVEVKPAVQDRHNPSNQSHKSPIQVNSHHDSHHYSHVAPGHENQRQNASRPNITIEYTHYA
ncbi:hypothetical protein ISCGN_031114 [Ixodes scapularis]